MSRSRKIGINKTPRQARRGVFARGGSKSSPAGSFRRFWARYRSVISSFVIFFGAVAVFIFLYSRLRATPSFDGFLRFTARVTAILLNLTGGGVVVKETLVSSPRFAFQIVDLCTAIMPMMIFTAAVLAFPSRIKDKGLGLLIGLAGIFVVNQLRLVSLFYIGSYVPGIFDTTHLLVWQSLMILASIGFWLLWAYKYVHATAV